MKKMIKTMLSFAAVVSAVTFSVVSCGPEGPVGEGYGDGQDKGPTEEQLAYADSLETALYKQARAMQVVLTSSEEPVLVSSCVAEEAENTYTITLTTGASFPIFIDNDETYADALSYVESEGKKLWAICDKDGNIVPVEDADGAGVELIIHIDMVGRLQAGRHASPVLLLLRHKRNGNSHQAKYVEQFFHSGQVVNPRGISSQPQRAQSRFQEGKKCASRQSCPLHQAQTHEAPVKRSSPA